MCGNAHTGWSAKSASLALAFDPRCPPVAALQKDLERDLERRLVPRKNSLVLLQVMDRPADLKR